MKMNRNNNLKLFAFALPLLFIFMAFAFSAPAPSYWHSSDSYSVELDGEGDAFVLAALSLESISTGNVSSITLEVPYDRVQIYKAAQGYYESAEFVDFDTTSLSDSTLVTIKLRDALTKNQRTTLALIYQVPAAAKPGLRGNSFRFETMKDKAALVRYVGVNVAVPENMFLKGRGGAGVKYKPSAMMESAVSAKAMMAESIRYYDYGYTPPAMHSARNVDPGESFVVDGLYGKSRALLYLAEIVVSLFGLAFLVLFARIFSIGGKVRHLFSGGVQEVPSAGGSNLFRSLVLGGASAVSFTLVYLLAGFISPLLSAANYSSSDFRSVTQLLFVILVWLLVLLSFALPAYYGLRNSWKEGIATFVFAIAFTMLLFFLISGGLFTTVGAGTTMVKLE